jgi:hypothetical protein
MSEIEEAARNAVEQAKTSRLNTMIAALVALTATFMALCNVKDGNVVQAMAKAQADSVDTWAYYQAKSMKQYLSETTVDQLTLQREMDTTLTTEAKAALDTRIAEYTSRVKRYDTEKEETKKKAEALSAAYDALNVHDDQFDMAEACLSVAIALFGVTALTQKRWLFGFAGLVAFCGLILGLAGFAGWSIHPDFLARLLG